MEHNHRAMRLTGVTVNNLKNLSVTIPKEKIVAFAGVSGSGKSSLVFDTIAAESARQLSATFPLYIRNKMPRYERPAAQLLEGLTPAVIVDQSPLGHNPHSTVGTVSDLSPLIRLLFSRAGESKVGAAIDFSSQSTFGVCRTCGGSGEKMELVVDRILDWDKSLNEGCIRFTPFKPRNWQWRLFAECGLLDPDKKLRDYTEQEWQDLLYKPLGEVKVPFHNKNGKTSMLLYEGLVPRFNRLYLNRDIYKLKAVKPAEIEALVERCRCPDCQGTGLPPQVLACRVQGLNIAEMNAMEIEDLLGVLESVDHPLGTSIARQAAAGLRRMVEVGLGYLSLGRRTDTLSGGEAQRLKLVRHLGSSLTNMTYIFDEPSAGLHPHDVHRMMRMLKALRNQGNTVLVVEHNRDVISVADEVLELGPAAGAGGGRIVYQGPVSGLMAADTATGRALRQGVRLNTAPKPWSEAYPIRDACANNLRHITVDIPKGVLTAVSGVAGSGKTSLICGEFLRRYPDAVVITQRAIGTSQRSTPATYTGVMDEIRRLFAAENGVDPGMFSFNSLGACPVCGGKGETYPDVAFADPVAVRCEACGGSRYSEEALSYLYHGRNITQVLNMTVEEAMDFFPSEKIRRSLAKLADVGLGYLTLGQPTSTLSGGENQRVKLAAELKKKGRVYILDEPTTGLHPTDIARLMELLRRLVDRDNTVIVIEHDLQVIAEADWVIDLGPAGGKAGGEVLFCGTPAELISCPASKTAAYLAKAVGYTGENF